jgi:hypothetical protein
MTCRDLTLRMASLAVAAAVVCGAGGCSFSRSIKFTNVSQTWLNVRYYVGEKDVPEPEEMTPLYWKKTQQVKPGDTARYTPPRTLVHIQVESVTPSWEPPAREYWLELLTRPPVHIVAAGSADKLDFKTGSGEVAIIPERELSSGRYEYRQQEPTPPTDVATTEAELEGPGQPALVGPASTP